MNGAQALIRTLVDSGVDTCFANPGTSEMHFVAALEHVPEMRAVLGLFEGVVSGAADGYGRMADRPAATLLHLGSGLGNGLANLHNAHRAGVPLVNIVGEHATYHIQYDAPLTSDIKSIASGVSNWIRTPQTPEQVPVAAAEAVAAAHGPPGDVVTLILPADTSWGEGAEPHAPLATAAPAVVDDSTVADVAKLLGSDSQSAILIGGSALDDEGLRAASRIANMTGTRLLAETFPARLSRGAGRVPIDRLGYLPEFVAVQLQGVENLITVQARSPVSFFAYPGKDSDLVPDGTAVHSLAGTGDDGIDALARVADLLGAAEGTETIQGESRPDLPQGPLSAETIAAAVGALLPENAIVSDESNTASLPLPAMTQGAAAHDWLTLTGGAIGQGMPVATGAAVACPDRQVLNLESDGSAMYTIQSLYTQARESLDVTTIVYNNRAYSILNLELSRVGAEQNERAKAMFDLSRPNLNFVEIARGMGVPGVRVETAQELCTALENAFVEDGPHLVDAIVPPII